MGVGVAKDGRKGQVQFGGRNMTKRLVGMVEGMENGE